MTWLIIIYIWAGLTTSFSFWQIHEMANSLSNFVDKPRIEMSLYFYGGIVVIWPLMLFIFLHTEWEFRDKSHG